MRKIDEAKRDAITKAVFQITYDEGITNLSISKIAKQVGVSKATMYVYYQDKTDMLGKIFLDVKYLMDSGLSEEIKRDLPFKQRVELTLEYFANKFVQYPYESNFMRAILDNPDLVDPEVIEKSQQMVQSLYDLFTEGVENSYWVTNDIELLTSILFSPIEEYTEMYFKKGQPVSQKKLNELIEILIQASVVE